ncbi:serine hydrolase domain-containing protein [Evansella cellulosilytica]|uniref:Beta-lactamase n=1 Tax=Evansella cellulosilytica (strain ATCC 21833 / DSM 2522 / FERM P-1141 / JCM 9156 / N-4) TaxID=649639 RepID=E6U002_EVAC2|nr:serine hydrolase [Evansella cellulosilytica]ADU29006.1 beta-lactamase [Evansella cellulosilytica DSM 2522]
MLSKTDIYELVTSLHDNYELSGVVFAKEKYNVMHEAGYGFSNRADELNNNVNTRFNIGNGGKIFTSIAISQLVEKGYFTFHSLLKDCLHYTFPHFDENITIHQLLTHTSGIPDYYDKDTLGDYEELWKDKPTYAFQQLKDFLPLFENGEMMHQPGERFYYNNAGYILLGLIIEEKTGIPFAQYVEENILDKCDMNDSGYFSMDQLPANTAIGYIDDEEKDSWRTNYFSLPIRGGADGGAYVTAPDMVKFWECLFKNKLLSREYTKKILEPYIKITSKEHYGYGLRITKMYNTVFKYHIKGYAPGVSFQASYYPKFHLKLIVTSNQKIGALDVTNAIEDNLTKDISIFFTD